VQKTQSQITTDGQSVIMSRYRAHSGTCDKILLSVRRLFSEICSLVFLRRPLWREVGSVICLEILWLHVCEPPMGTSNHYRGNGYANRYPSNSPINRISMVTNNRNNTWIVVRGVYTCVRLKTSTEIYGKMLESARWLGPVSTTTWTSADKILKAQVSLRKKHVLLVWQV
jgi:hypothetical protein